MLYTSKIILKFAVFLAVIIAAVNFSSCGDDPVTPTEPEFDPPRFNWRSIDIPADGFAGIWAQDTNNIYLLNHYDRTLMKVSNGNVTTFFVGDYYLNDIKGLSNNEIYLFGTGAYDRKLTIIKWNGGGFEYHPTNIIIPPNTGNIYSVKGLAISSNEVWVCSRNGIAKYDGIKLNYYAYDDPSLIPDNFFISNDNKVEYTGIDFDTAFTKISLYEYRDTGFVNIYSYYLYPSFSTNTYLAQIKGYKIGIKFINVPLTVCIDNFTGSSFAPYICFSNKITGTWRSVSTATGLTGTSLVNFMSLVQAIEGVFEPYRVGIVHWNGIKTSKELILRPIIDPNPFTAIMIYCINENTYMVLQPSSDSSPDNITLFIGNKK